MSIVSELNTLSSNGVITALLEIEIPSTPIVRITNNGEIVNFNGNDYIPLHFKLADLSTAGKGELPDWSIQIDNSTRIIESYLHLYDNYLKVNGIAGNEINCTCYIVNTNELSEAILTEYFILSSYSSDANYATFKLGAKSPFRMRYPRRRIIQNFCSWKFKSTQCGYSGSGVSCNKTLGACRSFNNSSRFGGFPGIGKGIRL